MEHLIKVEDLCKIYNPGENEVRALDHINLEIDEGEFVAIIGQSGSGKSTLLHLIGGVDTPTSGKVYVDGTDVYAQNEDALAVFRRRQVGLIYQFYNLIPVLNVEENMTLPVLMDARKVNQKRFDELIEVLNMKDRIHHLPNELSGGQQQRVSIGRALLNAPAILLADEPTSALDVTVQKQMVEEMLLFRRRYGTSIILVTHNIGVVSAMADTVLVLREGEAVEYGEAEKVLREPREAYTRELLLAAPRLRRK